MADGACCSRRKRLDHHISPHIRLGRVTAIRYNCRAILAIVSMHTQKKLQREVVMKSQTLQDIILEN